MLKAITNREMTRFRAACIDNYCINPDLCVVCKKTPIPDTYTIIIRFKLCNVECLQKFREFTTTGEKSFYCTPASAAGLITGINLRKAGLIGYYNNPSKCLRCSSIINIKSGERISEVRSKKFCNKSCAAIFNNKLNPKRVAVAQGECIECRAVILFKRLSHGGFSKRKLCETCLSIKRTKDIGHLKTKEHSDAAYKNTNLIVSRTKGELFENRKNWQSASSAIRKHARKVFALNSSTRKCFVCPYSNYFEVCHIKQVSDFLDTDTIGEINKFENLVALCPNHHWDLDHGLLSL